MDPETRPQQSHVLGHQEGNMLVTGPPGSGKTWLLRERFARLVETGADSERILFLALNRRAVREARDHLIRRLGRSLPDVPVFTVHGFAFGVLGRRFRELDYDAPPQILSAPEQYSVVREMLLAERAEDWPHFGELLRVRGFARQVADFVLRAQERLLDPDALDALVASSGRLDHEEVAAFYRRYLDAVSHAGQVDFAGLLFQTASLLRAAPSADERYEHVLVDDYQDATVATEGALLAVSRTARSLVVAADPDGHVFAYRGTTLDPLIRFRQVAAPVDHVELRGSYRLGGLGALEGLSASREATAPAGVTGGDGMVVAAAHQSLEARVLAHPGEEVEAVAAELLRIRVDEDVPWSQMAVVLRRYGPYLTALRHALSRHSIPYVVVAEAAALAREPATRPVIDLLRYCFRPQTRDDILEGLLVSAVVGLPPHEVRRLRREARKADVTLVELVERGDLACLHPELRDAVLDFRGLIGHVSTFAREAPPEDVFFELWGRLACFRELVASDHPGHERDLDAVYALSHALTRFSERRPGATIEDYLDSLDAAEFGPDPWIPPEERHRHAVRVLSAHGSQGLEFDSVLVPGCLEGEFPSLAEGDPLVSTQQLVEQASPRERAAARLVDERALFRLAVSRGRRRTVLFASRSTGARTPRTPSRFAERLGLAWTAPPLDRPAASLRTMEGSLRRRLSDRSEPPARRLAAAGALAHVGADPASWWGRRDWTDTGIPLSEEVIKTSYSRLTTMENCALQYLYSVEMGLDPDETYHMWLGSLVHSVIDRVQRRELEKSTRAMHEALDGEWRSDIFPNRAVEHRKYLDARGMLERWLASESSDPIASEVWFEFPVDGAIVRGRIDAIFPMNNGHARVVDYKTGMYAVTDEEAKRDLQLAAYYLALKRSPELSGLPEPGYLQLAYIGKAHYREGFVRRGISPNTVADYEGWADATLKGLLGRIRVEDFSPNPEADCRNCSFKTICPRWPQGGDVPLSSGVGT